MSTRSGSVLHFIDTTGPGGAETIMLQVATGLRDRDWSPHVALVGPGWVLDNTRELGLPVSIVETRGRLDVAYLRRLRALVRERDVRLIHAHLFSPAVYASLVGAWTGVPVVATFHGASDTRGGSWWRRIRYRLVDRYATIACVSEALKTQLASLDVMDAERVRVIHNGVDSAAFAAARGDEVRREHGIPEDTFLIGALGNLRPAKDFPNLLRAAAMLAPDQRYAFAIVGQRAEPLYGELRKLRDELGLADRVSFWGFREDVPEVMSAFDTLAISSSSEGFSLAAVQAMAAGTPVVATRSGGPEEILTDGVDGLLVPSKSPESLAQALQRIAGDGRLRSRLAERARQTVRERLSLNAMLDGYEGVYAALLERGDRAPALTRVAH